MRNTKATADHKTVLLCVETKHLHFRAPGEAYPGLDRAVVHGYNGFRPSSPPGKCERDDLRNRRYIRKYRIGRQNTDVGRDRTTLRSGKRLIDSKIRAKYT